jgi:outer membrane protein
MTVWRLRSLPLTRLVGLLALAFVPRVAFAEGKVGIIDTERAVMETDEGARALAALKQLFERRQADLDVKERALQQDKEAFDKEAAAGKTSKEGLQKKADALQKRFLELQQTSFDYQKEMREKRSELTDPIRLKVMSIVRSLAMQEGYELIIEKAVVPSFPPQIELTDRAIKLCNSSAPASPPPKPAPSGRKNPTKVAPKPTEKK